MPRLIGVDIPPQKRLEIALTYVYGIGRDTAQKICDATGLDRGMRSRELSEDQLALLATYIQKTYPVEGQLRRQIASNINRLREIGSYRGMRHRRGLPVRGQRTRTNARTRKGPRKTVAGKKSVKGMK
ncbi:MAG: 30S ribosomal protein S13 [Planctomycetes bacterium]|nr:30S ribosomal protein S13 [Planctomycetota bacterium]